MKKLLVFLRKIKLPTHLSSTWKERLMTWIPLFSIFAVGIFLRFYNLNWDNYSMFHPDERNIANAVTQIRFFSELNPHFFAYGGFSIYLYRAAAEIIVLLTKNTIWFMDWGHINIIGRTFSAFFSILTVIPLYFLAKKVFNKHTALLAISFFIFCVSSIQMAHFAVTESLLTLQAVTIALISILFFEKPTVWKSLLTGIVFGVALATKTSAASLVLMPFLSFLFAGWHKKTSRLKTIIYFFIFTVVTGIFFFVFSPYTILDYKHFSESMHYESGVATGSLPVVYTLQFNHTIPYLFQIINFFWQIGLLTPFAVVGFLLYIYLAIKTRKPILIIFLSFPLIYFLYVGSWHTKFIRYMMPVIPFFIIVGSALLLEIRNKRLLLGNILITILVLTTNLWAVAFFSIYTIPQTRIQASYWIYSHVPFGSRTLTEQWDDGLPIGIGQYNQGMYGSIGMANYDTDNQAKLVYFGTTLANADYIFLNSRRLYGTLIHLTKEYPLTSKYYKYLFAGKLGYKEVATFTSYPNLLGLQINDDLSEETFQVYDHPTVRILQNVKHYSAQKIENILKH